MIPSVEWAEKYKLKIARLDHLRKDFLKTKATELANKLIVDPIVEQMKLNEVARVIQESVVVKEVVVNETGILIKIYSEYFAENGFDVALAREKGTDDHFIAPKGKNQGGADVLHWIEGGKKRFSKGHIVSGLPRLNLIEQGVEKGEYELQQQLNEEARKWRREILK